MSEFPPLSSQACQCSLPPFLQRGQTPSPPLFWTCHISPPCLQRCQVPSSPFSKERWVFPAPTIQDCLIPSPQKKKKVIKSLTCASSIVTKSFHISFKAIKDPSLIQLPKTPHSPSSDSYLESPSTPYLEITLFTMYCNSTLCYYISICWVPMFTNILPYLIFLILPGSLVTIVSNDSGTEMQHVRQECATRTIILIVQWHVGLPSDEVFFLHGVFMWKLNWLTFPGIDTFHRLLCAICSVQQFSANLFMIRKFFVIHGTFALCYFSSTTQLWHCK